MVRRDLQTTRGRPDREGQGSGGDLLGIVPARPEDSTAGGGFVLGHQGDVSALPEALQRKEQASDRKPVSDFVFKGGRVSG